MLSEAGYEFTVVVPDINEASFEANNVEPNEYAKTLALAKAKNVAAQFANHLVIGADTIVDFNGEIIGKPTDEKDAERITKKLFSAPHKVITSLAIIIANQKIELVESETTTVYPRKMTAGQIAAHIKGKSWQDKAGAYAIQENGDEFIEKIEGSLTNVMGLPMELLQQMLDKLPSISLRTGRTCK